MNKLSVPQILAICISSYSCVVMAGWIFNIDALTRILPNEINMKFTTAFAFFLSSIGLWCIDLAARDKKEIAQVVLPGIELIILLIMATLIAGGLFNIPTGITELFVKSFSVKTVAPGMPSLPSMFAFILFGVACILGVLESTWVRQAAFSLGIPIMLIGFIPFFGYLLRIPLLYYKFTGTTNPIALNSAILFLLLGFGLLVVRRGKQ